MQIRCIEPEYMSDVERIVHAVQISENIKDYYCFMERIEIGILPNGQNHKHWSANIPVFNSYEHSKFQA